MALVYGMCLIGLVLSIALDGTSAETRADHMTHKEIRQFFVDSGYDGADPPDFDRSTEVRLGVYVNSIDLNSETGRMVTSSYVRTGWQDNRLKPLFENTTLKKLRINDRDLISKVWRPDIFLRNSDKADTVDAFSHNALMRINSTGHVWYVVKTINHIICPSLAIGGRGAVCRFIFESFGYTMDTLHFKWLDHAVDIDRDVNLPSYTLTDTFVDDCSQNYTAGSFPCYSIGFVLRSEIGAIIYRQGVYIISILLVIISWLSFWLPPNEIRTFLGIGCTAILSVIYLVISGWTEYTFRHRANHAQAWIIFCICFVLIMVFVNLILSLQYGSLRSKLNGLCGRGGDTPQVALENKRSKRTEMAESVFCLILFPATFIIGFIWFAVMSVAFKY